MSDQGIEAALEAALDAALNTAETDRLGNPTNISRIVIDAALNAALPALTKHIEDQFIDRLEGEGATRRVAEMLSEKPALNYPLHREQLETRAHRLLQAAINHAREAEGGGNG